MKTPVLIDISVTCARTAKARNTSHTMSSDYMNYRLNLYYNLGHTSIVYFLYRPLCSPVRDDTCDGKLGNYRLPRNVMLDRHKNQFKEVLALVLMCHELAHNVRTLLTIRYALW